MRSDSNGLPCTMGGLVENGREGCGRESVEGGWKEISRSAKAPAPSLPEGGQFVQTNQENDPGDTFSVPHLLHAGGRAQFLSRHALVECVCVCVGGVWGVWG